MENNDNLNNNTKTQWEKRRRIGGGPQVMNMPKKKRAKYDETNQDESE
jgi:hypothetical protein